MKVVSILALKEDPQGERLAKDAQERNILLMLCDQRPYERGLTTGEPANCQSTGTVDGVRLDA